MDRYLSRTVVAVSASDGKRLRESFTGKLVKSLVIDGNPSLKRFFEKSSGCAPKLVHVSPLYVEEDVSGSRRVRCVYHVESGGARKYSFYVGFAEAQSQDSPSFDDVYSALMNITGYHKFGDGIINVELMSLEFLDVAKYVKGALKSLLERGKIKIIFASPTLLRDPLRSSKYKSLTPTSMNIFATPLYVNLYVTGRLKHKLFIRTLLILHRLLNEPYSIYKTVNIAWIRYSMNKNPIPTIIGYVNLFLNRYYYDQYVGNDIDIEKLLEETFSTMLTLGTGTSRATGFGHITISATSGT